MGKDTITSCQSSRIPCLRAHLESNIDQEWRRLSDTISMTPSSGIKKKLTEVPDAPERLA